MYVCVCVYQRCQRAREPNAEAGLVDYDSPSLIGSLPNWESAFILVVNMLLNSFRSVLIPQSLRHILSDKQRFAPLQ